MRYHFLEFTLATDTFVLKREGVPLHLEPQDFDVLRYLVAHRDRVVTRDELFSNLWKGKIVTEATLSSRLKNIRRALGDSGAQQRVIQTVHGRGYRFLPLVTEDRVADGLESPMDSVPAAAHATPTSHRLEVAPTGAPTRLLMVGRNAEINELAQHLRGIQQGARIVFVLGESGIGKTMLVNQFVAAASEIGSRVITGHVLAESSALEPLLPLVDALSSAVRSPQGLAVASALRRAAPSWCARFPEILGETQGAADAVLKGDPPSRERLFIETVDVLTLLTKEAPVVLVLEDIHWADPSTLAWLDYLSRRRLQSPLLVLATIRTGTGNDDARRVATALSMRNSAAQIMLTPLDEASIGDLLTLRAGEPVEPALVSLFTRYCGGHPLFAQLAVDSWLRNRDDRALSTHVLTVPNTLRDLVETRLTDLEPRTVALLEAASVVGVEFSAPLVAAALLEGDEDTAAVERELLALARARGYPRIAGELRWPDGTRCTRFQFLHQFFAQCLYSRQGAATLQRRHGRVGERLVQLSGARQHEHVGELIDHFEKAGQPREAARYCALGSDLAAARGGARESVALARRGLDCLREGAADSTRDLQELQLLSQLARGLAAHEGYAASETLQVLETANRLAKRIDRPQDRLPIINGLFNQALTAGATARAATIADEFIDLATTLNDPSLAVAWRQRGWTHLIRGNFVGAATDFRRTKAAMRRGLNLPTSHVFSDVDDVTDAADALCQYFLGEPQAALDLSRNLLARAQDLGHLVMRAYASTTHAFLLAMHEEVEEAQALALATIEQTERDGIPMFYAWSRYIRAWTLARHGASEEALELFRSAYTEAQTRGAKIFATVYATLIADTLERSGLVEEALQEIARGREASAETEERLLLAELDRLEGQLKYTADVEAATRAFRTALATAKEQSALTLQVRSAYAWAAAEQTHSARDGRARGEGMQSLKSYAGSLRLLPRTWQLRARQLINIDG